MSFLKTSDGTAITDDKEFSKGGGAMEPIPAKTQLKAMIDEAKWADIEKTGEAYISLRWTVLDGTYKNRKIFQKVRVNNVDAKKRDKDMRMLAAIDANAGGMLRGIESEPSDLELMKALCNKMMAIIVQVWNDEAGNPKGNWVSAVSPINKAAPPKKTDDDLEADIPWG